MKPQDERTHPKQHAASVLGALDRWNRRGQDRFLLCGLTAHQLRDLGLTRDDVGAEACKPSWRA